MNNPLGVSPSKGHNIHTLTFSSPRFTRLTPSGLFMGLSSTLIYTSELILCSTICVPSATRHNIKMTFYDQNINRCASPFCECGLDTESVKHFFLFCPRYAAQRNLLLTSAANILGETWSSSSDAKKLNFLLYGVKSANYDINCALFREVQTFIINTNRFSMATV